MAETALDNQNDDILHLIGRSWGWVLAFGVATLVLGILVIVQPTATIYGFAILLGIWLFVSGLFRMVMAIADDHDTRSDPDMDVKRQFLCRRDRREAGADRLRRIVLLGARPAEISEDTVAEIIGDVPAKALHHCRHRLMIAPK